MFAKFSLKPKIPFNMHGWQQSTVVRFLLYLLLFLIFFITIRGSVIPPTYDIEMNTVSEVEIKAPMKLLDEEKTEEAAAAAAAKIQDVYTSVTINHKDLIENIYEKLTEINGDPQFTISEKVEIYQEFFSQEFRAFEERILSNVSNRPELQAEIEKQLTEQNYRIPEEVYFILPRVSVETLPDMKNVTLEIVNRLMNDSLLDVTGAREKVAELVNASDLPSANAREIVQEISRYVMTPNRFYDEQATREAKENARESVEPIYIEQGDTIVEVGQTITPEIYEKLEALKLLDSKNSYWSDLGLALLLLLLVLSIYVFNRQSRQPIRKNNHPLLMLVLIYTINMICMKIVHLGQNLDYPYIGYLAPVAVGSMLLTILLDTRIAIYSTFLFSILSSMMFNSSIGETMFDFRFGLIAAVVGMVSIFAINRASQRSAIIKAGLLISLFSGITIFSIALVNNVYTTKDIIMSITFAFVSGLLTTVLVIGLLPFFEVSFGILSPLRLVELSNPNHPLLRKLLTETPGTYHHSVMVGNLSEAAAESIGANGLLCRVGSFYHDIGKTKRPSYFIENQGNMDNPHDHIEPSLSHSIIVAHARDGVEMLKEYKIPKQICDIAGQHHGTTLLKYFYHKALKQQQELPEDEREEILEEDFRYPGPKAQTKEAAIVGISDCVEAAVRSLRSPTIEQIDSMVDKIIKDRLEDGQFNECDLTLKELDQVGKSLKESLLGIFHSRIEYPELPGNKKS